MSALLDEIIAAAQSSQGHRVRGDTCKRIADWGSCNPRDRHIRLNTELARKPPECLEYVLVHELAHLLEPSHNARFIALMDRFLAGWRDARDQLNRLPISHVDWDY
jgi:predicted metal-dependent hydrolase